MRKMKNFFILLFALSSLVSRAQSPETVHSYIETYKEIAIEEMLRTGVPASIKLAQGIYETTAGTSNLVLKSNNHFGIKCKSNWTGPSVSHDDDARGECFRKYPTPQQSYRDHSDFLKNNGRYASLFTLDPSDYQGWANGLKKAGYATNPKYPQALIRVIEQYKLQDYTLLALARKEGPTDIVVAGQPGTVDAGIQVKPETAVAAPVIEIPEVKKVSYPEGEFRINDTKVIYAKKGTSFLAIASKYNVDLAKIFDFNELKESELLEKDQLIYLQRKRKTGRDDFYVMLPGDNLNDIAQHQAIRLESLLAFNYLSPGQVPAVGEKLYLKSKAPVMPRLIAKTDYSITPGNRTKPE